MKVEFHSDNLRDPLSKQIKKYSTNCESIDIAIGYLSNSGLKKIVELCKKNKSITRIRIVCGSITGSAVILAKTAHPFKKIDIKIDFPYFHKGSKYASIMHSKIYIFKTADARTSIAGSSNLTHYAMEGINVEANTIVCGHKDEQLFISQQKHFDNVWSRSQVLNHRLAFYYDTFFMHLMKGFAFPEFKGCIFDIKSPIPIYSYAQIHNSTKTIPNIGDKILWLNCSRQFPSLISKHQLFFIASGTGSGDYIVVECSGGMRGGVGSGNHMEDHNFRIDNKLGRYDLISRGPSTFSGGIAYATFIVKKVVKRHEIFSGKMVKLGKETSVRSETHIVEHLKFDPNDTITVEPNEFREDFIVKKGDEIMQKIVGFKESRADKFLTNLLIRDEKQIIENLMDEDTDHEIHFFEEILYSEFNISDDGLGKEELLIPEILLKKI